VVDDLSERPHFEVPIGALDPQQFAGCLGPFDEFAQIRMGAIVGVKTLRLSGLEHLPALQSCTTTISICNSPASKISKLTATRTAMTAAALAK
jgi:hypothetical protein